MRGGDLITELYPNMNPLNVKPGLFTKFYIDDVRTCTAEKDEDPENDNEEKEKDHTEVHSKKDKEKRPTRAQEKEPEPKAETEDKEEPEKINKIRPMGVLTPRRRNRGAASMTNSPKIMEYMIRNMKKDKRKDNTERRTQGEEVTEETTDKIEVAPEQTNTHENELEKEKEKPDNLETEKMMKREQSGEAGGLRTTSQEVRTVWSATSEEVSKSTTN